MPFRDPSRGILGSRRKTIRTPGRKGVVRPDELKSAALRDSEEFATAAQGLLADSAYQPGDEIAEADLPSNVPRLDAATNVFTGDAEFANLDVTADLTVGGDGGFDNVDATTSLKVAGDKVVGSRKAAVSNLSVSATTGSLPTADGSVVIADAASPTNAELLEYCRELEAKLETVLFRLRSHGLIAT